MIKSTKALLLAGASALAILASAAQANAETFTMPGMFSFTAAVSGEYALELLGASGGNSIFGAVGGSGAEVSGDVSLTAGEVLTLFVGGQGESSIVGGGGGGGGSFVFQGAAILAVAGGGGGASYSANGGPGLAGTSGGAGQGHEPGAGGVGGDGGGSGYGGGGGAGVNAGSAGNGGDGFGAFPAFGGKFPNGGGGYGGGGYGGGGAGALGGGGGSGFSGGGGGGGGGSYLASLFKDQVLTAGVNSGDGSISIAVVPEPSTWAMMAAGFAGLGLLAHMRQRKLTPA
jgi:hypothetical protein